MANIMNDTKRKTPTAEFFEEVLNGVDYPNEKKVLIISKFDEAGNWAVFNCAHDEDDNTLAYGGHIGLCSESDESYLTVPDLLYWLDRFRTNGIKVIVDENWYLNLFDNSDTCIQLVPTKDIYFGKKVVTQRIIEERKEPIITYGLVLGESGGGKHINSTVLNLNKE